MKNFDKEEYNFTHQPMSGKFRWNTRGTGIKWNSDEKKKKKDNHFFRFLRKFDGKQIKKIQEESDKKGCFPRSHKFFKELYEKKRVGEFMLTKDNRLKVKRVKHSKPKFFYIPGPEYYWTTYLRKKKGTETLFKLFKPSDFEHNEYYETLVLSDLVDKSDAEYLVERIRTTSISKIVYEFTGKHQNLNLIHGLWGPEFGGYFLNNIDLVSYMFELDHIDKHIEKIPVKKKASNPYTCRGNRKPSTKKRN